MEILNVRARSNTALPRFLCLLVLATVASLAQGLDEYEVKAAFLYNFTKFVEWPRAITTPFFAICILGDDPFDSAIDRLTAGKTASGLPIQVRRLKDEAQAKECQIVFVGGAEKVKAAKLIDATRGSPVLTVGESQEFVRIGGMISLSMESNRVSVVINKAATDGSGLQVSAKLMTLAKIYRP